MPYLGIDAKKDIRLNATSDLDLTSDSTTIKFGADDDVTLTHVHNTGLLLNSTNQFQFGDSGTYIHQSADGVLDLVSDTEIEINATTIDMNGAVDVSGNATFGGTVNIGTTGSLSNNSGTFLIDANTNLTFRGGVQTFDNADGSTEYMRLNSDGDLLLGSSTDAGYGPLQIGSTSTASTIAQFLSATDGVNTIHFGDATSGTARYRGYIQYRHNGDKLTFGTSAADAVIIDSNGNVGIGTTSIDVSTQAGGSGYRVLQIENDEGGQINLDHNDAGTGSTLGQINFQRAGEVLAEIEGVTDGATDNAKINFRTQPDGGALTIRATIDHDGNVGINTSSPSTYVDGSSGTTLSIESSGTNRGALVFASECTGGSNEILGIINFTDTANTASNYRAAAIKGHKGSGNGDAYLTFHTDNTERMRILKDGGLTFNGDTATANALDDYEEGTWTPVYRDQSNASTLTITYDVQNGNYTKIGNTCIAHFSLGTDSVSGGSSSTYLAIGGLPFTSASDEARGSLIIGGKYSWPGNQPTQGSLFASNTIHNLWQGTSAAPNVATDQLGTGANSNRMHGTIIYKTA